MRLPKHGPPVTLGEILLEEFLVPLEMPQSELAQRIGVPFQRVNQIIKGKRAITPDTALRLSRMFGTTQDVWLNLQMAHDLYETMHSMSAKEFKRIRPAIVAAA